MKYRKKPVIIEAEQFFSDKTPWPKGVSEEGHLISGRQFGVTTIHGYWTPVVDGDWILPELDGEHFYPCKPDIFANTYEPLPESSANDSPKDGVIS